ncbi:(Fe-S)-binding protein [Paenibacillus sp. GCM10027627]|uniref:(Fe-S)-binding protein n=1 Tax=unclassified Paenibacillus TaxID=185978 RepID=UPI003644E8DC
MFAASFPEAQALIRWLFFAALIGIAVWMFAAVVWRRIGYIKLGAPAVFARYRARGRTGFGKEVFGHRRLLNDLRSGLMHLVYFYGFILLQFGATDLIWKGLSGGHPLPIPYYSMFSWSQEVTATLVLAAMLYGGYRRYGEKLARLKRGWKPSLVLWFIGSLMLTVLLTLSFERLSAEKAELVASPYAPVSEPLSRLIHFLGVEEGSWLAHAGHELFWWLHLLVLLSFLVYVPQSKHFHLITAPVNLYFRRSTPTGRLVPLDLENEEAESFGAGKVEHFTRKQLLDLYACVECGRCTNVCPAASTGKLLSPMHLIVKLRDHLTEKGASITSKSPWLPASLWQRGDAGLAGAHVMGATIPAWEAAYGKEESAESSCRTSITPTMSAQGEAWSKRREAKAEELELIGDVISEEELWACTTCRNCEEQCPVGNEHVDKIIDMRRHLVLMEGKLPSDGQRALQNIERQSNPWGLPRAERAAWIDECESKTGIRVATMRERKAGGSAPEVLLWAGSMGAYDSRSRKVLYDLVRLLAKAGVDFATLGLEEKSSGDTARRIGNELLFQELCRDNIAVLQKYGVRHIVTACPHTFHTFKNEYPDFGLEGVKVEHHTQFLARLLKENKLTPRLALEEKITVHDSCYLGRYNDTYDAPRSLIRAIPGASIAEMERSGPNGMCCGAGGGMMWMEEHAGVRVNYARTAQALEVAPTVVSSACPYCLTMMEDGLKSLADGKGVVARDVAELLADSIFGERS